MTTLTFQFTSAGPVRSPYFFLRKEESVNVAFSGFTPDLGSTGEGIKLQVSQVGALAFTPVKTYPLAQITGGDFSDVYENKTGFDVLIRLEAQPGWGDTVNTAISDISDPIEEYLDQFKRPDGTPFMVIYDDHVDFSALTVAGAGVATSAEVTAAIAAALTAYYTSAQVDTLLTSYYTSAQVDTLLAAYYTSAQVDTLLTSYYTAAQVDTLLASYYTSAQVDALLASYATLTGVQTLTNKRIVARTSTETSSATPTINSDNVDYHAITALVANITSFTTNLSGTPVRGDSLFVEITAAGAQTIAWGASFEDGVTSLPTAINAETMLVALAWNAVSSKWRCVGVA